ncbi:MAG: GDSL-type esterase/lipase family protein [Saprospiraceae bacterium]|nr:GDSL-type esterase/lipase family protein [Saprospiraceae bacterium]
MKPFYFTILFQVIILTGLMGQDPHAFDKEIDRFDRIITSKSQDISIFTGSSSIRMWKDLAADCKNEHVINTGFGGSQMSDLLFHLERTVLRFKPRKVYIYEGDNDIAAGKSPTEILTTTKEVVKQILSALPHSTIYFISAKPSPSRWAYEQQYLAFNSLLKVYCKSHSQLKYIDVWTPMVESNSRPDPSIFIADSLHMNRKGYEMWKEIICTESH